MNTRRGLGKGLGAGYKNLAYKDPMIHGLSAKGVKTYPDYPDYVSFRPFNKLQTARIKKYQGGLSTPVIENENAREYIDSKFSVSGYFGNSERTPARDKIVEKILLEKGLNEYGIAEYLTSTSGRHLMDEVDSTMSNKKFERHARNYLAKADKELLKWKSDEIYKDGYMKEKRANQIWQLEAKSKTNTVKYTTEDEDRYWGNQWKVGSTVTVTDGDWTIGRGKIIGFRDDNDYWAIVELGEVPENNPYPVAGHPTQTYAYKLYTYKTRLNALKKGGKIDLTPTWASVGVMVERGMLKPSFLQPALKITDSVRNTLEEGYPSVKIVKVGKRVSIYPVGKKVVPERVSIIPNFTDLAKMVEQGHIKDRRGIFNPALEFVDSVNSMMKSGKRTVYVTMDRATGKVTLK